MFMGEVASCNTGYSNHTARFNILNTLSFYLKVEYGISVKSLTV